MLGEDVAVPDDGRRRICRTREVQRISHRVARGLQRSGIAAGDKVAVLSSNDATGLRLRVRHVARRPPCGAR